MNAPDLQTIKNLLRDILAGFVTEREAITIQCQPAVGACYWMIRVAPKDDPKVVGKEGTHARALAAMIAAFGEAEDEEHTFRLLTNDERTTRSAERIRDVMSYDPEPIRALLVRTLELLPLDGFAVDVGPGTGARDTLTFVFGVRVATAADRAFLLKPRAGDQTLIGAIGTLFRAIGRKDGVAFEVLIATPAPAKL